MTLSSTEAEYYAISETVVEIIFVKNILEFMGVEVKLPIVVKTDNIGAMFLSKNPSSSQRTCHIDVRTHFIRDFVEDEVIEIKFIPSEENESDVFTKHVSLCLYEKHIKKFMGDDDD